MIRCRCGSVMDFTRIVKCRGCERPIQACCIRRFDQAPYCKECFKKRSDTRSRKVTHSERGTA